MTRTKQCFIGLGSNLQKPLEQVKTALQSLAQLGHCTLGSVSACYQSRAVGPGEQDDYINAVAELHTTLTPESLLTKLQAIENDQGRVRLERWGPRTLDLDLLWFAGETIASANLSVPHPRILERNFVLFPLADLAPDLILANGQSCREAAEAIGRQGLQQLEH